MHSGALTASSGMIKQHSGANEKRWSQSPFHLAEMVEAAATVMDLHVN